VQGPWAAALSDYAGRELRLARTDAPGRAVDRPDGSVSIVSDESVDELARQAGVDDADARRFRMLVGAHGGEPHVEDTWIGRDVRIGDAVVRVHEQVARLRDHDEEPDTGERDLDTLRVIRAYRGTRGTEAPRLRRLRRGRHAGLVCASATRSSRLRNRFPILSQLTYLNSCSHGALSTDVREAYAQYLRDWQELGSPWELWGEKTEEARAAFAELVRRGADRRRGDDVASAA
jgi:hypothetical protein